MLSEIKTILSDIKTSSDMKKLWDNYIKKNDYIGELGWLDTLDTIEKIFSDLFETADMV